MGETKPGAARPVPAGYHAVTPFVIARGAAHFIDFMKDAFDATEIARVADWPATPAFLRLYVADVDRTHQRALDAGATSVIDLTNMPWGDRVCRVRDPLGSLWWLMTRVEDVSPEEQENRYGEQQYIDAMSYVQSTDFFADKR